MIGKTLAHYQVVEKIGAGGMGEVYRATDSKLGRDVALKILPENFAKDSERMARFQREAQVLARLNHTNIAAIYGVETQGNATALVLELVHGPTLSDRIRAGPIPVDEALPIARQIADAIECAHESGIIHRDLKPANVKLTPEGNVKLLDFGLAKALEADPGQSGTDLESPTISPAFTSPLITGGLTGANVILGTAAYMSPEQARAKRVDRRCDIWSFGVVLFEMLTGRSLFAGETVSDTLAAVLKTDPDWDHLPADLSPRIRRLLRRCLEREPRKRLRDIGDARVAIEEVLDGREETLDETLPSAATGGRRNAERIVWLGLGVLVAAIALSLWGRFAGTEPTGVGGDWRLSIAREGRPAGGGYAESSPMAVSPDGSIVAFVGAGGIRIRHLGRLDPVLLEDTKGAALPFWSPDGRSLGFYQNRELKRIDLHTGFVETIADMPNPRAPGTWLEGDQILYEPTFADELMIVPASGNSPPVPVTEKGDNPSPSAGHRWAAPLPDGTRFLFVETDYASGTSSIRLGSLGSLVTHEIEPPQTGIVTGLSLVGAHVLYLRESVLLAHPFDPQRAALTGDPQVMLGGAKILAYSISDNGVLAWIPARDEREERARLTWLDRDGATLETFADLPGNPGCPRLSLDSRYFVFDAGSEDLAGMEALFVYDLKRATLRRLASISAIHGTWSPDGRQIAFLSATDTKMWITEATGTTSPERALGEWPVGDRLEVPMDWSPDGRHVVFLLVREGSADLWILPLGEGAPFAYLEDDEANFHQASFAPGGGWIAYASDQSGRDEVYVDSFPDRGSRTQVSTKGGEWPRWRRDGRELFFVTEDEQSDLVEFKAVDVEDTGGQLSFGTPVTLFEARAKVWNSYYDVSADGERFLVSILPDLPPRPIHVMANWKRALEE